MCVYNLEHPYLGCTCSFWIFWKNNVYSSRTESALQNLEFHVDHTSDVACDIKKGTSVNCRCHQPRLARIGRRMCATCKRHPIGHELWCISCLASVHRASDVANNKNHQPRPTGMSCGAHASVGRQWDWETSDKPSKARPLRASNVGQWQMKLAKRHLLFTDNIYCNLCTSLKQRWSCTACIGRFFCIYLSHFLASTADIALGLHTTVNRLW